MSHDDHRPARVLVTLGLIMAVVATMWPPASAAASDRPTAASTASEHEQRLRAAEEVVSLPVERDEPLREGPRPRSDEPWLATVQDYHDTCGDNGVGDLLRLGNIDAGSLIGWYWETCAQRAFRGSEEELVWMLFFDLDQPFSPDPDRAVLQWPADGYFQVYDARRSSELADWVLIEGEFGRVRTGSGGTDEGEFILDATAARFPTNYMFAVFTTSGEQILDTIPKSDHPFPAYPTICTRIIELSAEIVLEEGVVADEVVAQIAATGATIRDTAWARYGILIADDVDDGLLAQLDAIPGVRSVQRPQPAEVATLSDQWHLDQLNLAGQWPNLPAEPTHIAVIDTGVDVLHPAISTSVGAGYDAVTEQVVAADRSSNMGYHGTQVASMIVGDATAGVYGINPRATIRPIALASHDGCLTSDRIATGILAAAAMPEVTVINLSLGGPESSVVREAVEVAQRAGKLVVAGTGNDQEDFPGRRNYPASFPSVIGVGATTPDASPAVFSQIAGADVLAPGQQVRAAVATGGSELLDGTSFAAPLVAGALSTWRVRNPGATSAQARDALLAASVAVPGSSAPRLDAALLLAAQPEPEPQPAPDPEPEPDPGVDPPPASPEPTPAPTPEPTPSPTPEPTPVFIDVAGSVHAPAISAVAAAGITTGCSATAYCPDQPVTRAQMASFLTRALALPPAQNAGYTDVDPTSVHAPAISAVAAAGITTGVTPTTFAPDQSVTRGQMASFLTRALALPPAQNAGYTDVGPTSVHAPAISAVAAAGITTGVTPTTFAPDLPVRRDQMASFLARALGL